MKILLSEKELCEVLHAGLDDHLDRNYRKTHLVGAFQWDPELREMTVIFVDNFVSEDDEA